jgi:hypothetical protein
MFWYAGIASCFDGESKNSCDIVSIQQLSKVDTVKARDLLGE